MRLPPPPPDTPNEGRKNPFVALVEPEDAIEKHSRKWQVSLVSAGVLAAALVDLIVRVLT